MGLFLIIVWEKVVARPAFGGSLLGSAVGLLIFSEADVVVTVGDWIGARCRAGVGGGA